MEESEDGVRTKSIFVKVPLKGTSSAESALFKAFNERELTMLVDVLPKLQTFLDERYNFRCFIILEKLPKNRVVLMMIHFIITFIN